jgi:hypothetical protein
MHHAAHVLFRGVLDRLVRCNVFGHAIVEVAFVGVQNSLFRDVLAHDLGHSPLIGNARME